MTGEFSIAVHALVYLHHKKSTLTSEVLAENVCTNPARIRKVMAKLKKAGFVITKEGAEGGYLFNREAGAVNLRQICEAVETTLVSASWKSGSQEMDCLIASGMANIMDGICGEMNDLCKEKLAGITILDVDEKIFKSN